MVSVRVIFVACFVYGVLDNPFVISELVGAQWHKLGFGVFLESIIVC